MELILFGYICLYEHIEGKMMTDRSLLSRYDVLFAQTLEI